MFWNILNSLFNFVTYIWVTVLISIWIIFIVSSIFLFYKIYQFKREIKKENINLMNEIENIKNIDDLEKLKEIEKEVDKELEEQLKQKLKKSD